MLYYITKHMPKQVSAEGEMGVYRRTSKGRMANCDFLASLHSRSTLQSAVTCTSASQLSNMDVKHFLRYTTSWRKLESLWNAGTWARVGPCCTEQLCFEAAGPRAAQLCTAADCCHVTNVSLLLKYLQLHISLLCWLMTDIFLPMHSKIKNMLY